MADEDDFDIDIYGDDKPPEPAVAPVSKPVTSSASTAAESQAVPKTKGPNAKVNDERRKHGQSHGDKAGDEAMGNTDDPITAEGDADSYDQTGYDGSNSVVAQSDDGRRGSEAASSALKLAKISWWTTEDDIRGWLNQAGVEGELKEITFSELKINGKSKEEAYVEFESIQAATTAKEHIEQKFAKEPPIKQVTAEFASSHRNPFKGNDAAPRPNTNTRQQGYNSGGYNQGGYRGRGGFNRGGYGGQSRGGYNNHCQMNTGNFGGMNNFGNMRFNRGGGNMMGMNRGGFQGNRGRGGMMGGNMGMMPNMGMGMGGMGMGMGMGMMGMDMSSMMGGMGFGGFNQFNNNQQHQGNAQGGTGNPHGAKRPRPE